MYFYSNPETLNVRCLACRTDRGMTMRRLGLMIAALLNEVRRLSRGLLRSLFSAVMFLLAMPPGEAPSQTRTIRIVVPLPI